MTTVPGILYNQFFVTPPYPHQDFTGLTVIVTGANTGLGQEAARHFVRLNAARVILAVRSIKKGENAQKYIEESTKRKGVVEVWQLDLSRYDSVKEFASKCNKELDRLDCLVENAAISTSVYEEFEGTESTLTVNIFSTFLLGILLLPLLRKTAKKFNKYTVLTFIASEVHGLVELPERFKPSILDAVNAERDSKSMGRRYMVSKLLEVLVARELAAQVGKVEDQGVIINIVNPGFCVSELVRSASLLERIGVWIMQAILARTTEVGARTEVYGAAGSIETHGQYMGNCVVEPPSTFVRSEDGAETQRRLYAELLERLERIQPGISKLIKAT
ncbi:hypothetical protein F5884DRAFT_474999 [Xylogone sp. PMI_703]|nr:hypothetical protein F5884DRAFT_474999 [Xylogone sp. PMI_703]